MSLVSLTNSFVARIGGRFQTAYLSAVWNNPREKEKLILCQNCYSLFFLLIILNSLLLFFFSPIRWALIVAVLSFNVIFLSWVFLSILWTHFRNAVFSLISSEITHNFHLLHGVIFMLCSLYSFWLYCFFLLATALCNIYIGVLLIINRLWIGDIFLRSAICPTIKLWEKGSGEWLGKVASLNFPSYLGRLSHQHISLVLWSEWEVEPLCHRFFLFRLINTTRTSESRSGGRGLTQTN